MNTREIECTCALCQTPSPFGLGPAFFLGEDLICSACARKASPTLYQVLLKFYSEGLPGLSKDGKICCVWCGAWVDERYEEIPGMDDHARWLEYSALHKAGCPWIRTRAGTLESLGGD
jgi:hypothetical protein